MYYILTALWQYNVSILDQPILTAVFYNFNANVTRSLITKLTP